MRCILSVKKSKPCLLSLLPRIFSLRKWTVGSNNSRNTIKTFLPANHVTREQKGISFHLFPWSSSKKCFNWWWAFISQQMKLNIFGVVPVTFSYLIYLALKCTWRIMQGMSWHYYFFGMLSRAQLNLHFYLKFQVLCLASYWHFIW